MTERLKQSTRVAAAAYLHDVGKFAQRAERYDKHLHRKAHIQLYCPFRQQGGYHSHLHAADTALAIDELEQFIPDIGGVDAAPFSGRQTIADSADELSIDSFINAAAAHHKPETFLQWIVATADRLASGLDRDEFQKYNEAEEKEKKPTYKTARMLSIFEQLDASKSNATAGNLNYRYPLKPQTPKSIFPERRQKAVPRKPKEAVRQYKMLWKGFTDALRRIPPEHRNDLPLWLDHFDSAWQVYTQAIPSATAFNVKPDVSLYDHSRSVACLAAALWQWHVHAGKTDQQAIKALSERRDFDEDKFLVVQGDFFGIQSFIFADGSQTNKHAAKLLRGRSFQVSLFTELAALKVLESLDLPSTSMVLNAAGKFQLICPNTPHAINTLQRVKEDINAWFLSNVFGMAGIGIAWTPASCNSFLLFKNNRGFEALQDKLHNDLEMEKYRRFNLVEQGAEVFSGAQYPEGPCSYNARMPADSSNKRDTVSCALSRDQVAIGEALVRDDCLALFSADVSRKPSLPTHVHQLEAIVFGYRVVFFQTSGTDELIRHLAKNPQAESLQRCFSIAIPKTDTDTAFNGLASRHISGYVPRITDEDLLADAEKYVNISNDEMKVHAIKPFDMLACEDRTVNDAKTMTGRVALAALKGDIDDLGALFIDKLQAENFTKYAALSRKVNVFFSFWLPYVQATKFPNIYTLFAGGDDFFLIGSWRDVQRFAREMQTEFSRYVANNPDIHFSVGIATFKPGAPVETYAIAAEGALDASKAYDKDKHYKNSITCFGETVPWPQWGEIEAAEESLQRLRKEMADSGQSLSTGFVYDLQKFIDMQKESAVRPEAAIWRSQFVYRTVRLAESIYGKRNEVAKQQLIEKLASEIADKGIAKLSEAYRICLYNHLYQYRDR